MIQLQRSPLKNRGRSPITLWSGCFFVYWLPSKKGVFPNVAGEYSLRGVYTSSNIKFNNGFTEADLGI